MAPDQGQASRIVNERAMNKEELRRKRARAASRRIVWARMATVAVALAALLGWAAVAFDVM